MESRVHDNKESLKVEKAVGDPYDDVWDALRYAVYSHHDPEKKPWEMRFKERFNAIWNGDEKKGILQDQTAAVAQFHKIMAEEQEGDDEPSYYTRRARRRVRWRETTSSTPSSLIFQGPRRPLHRGPLSGPRGRSAEGLPDY